MVAEARDSGDDTRGGGSTASVSPIKSNRGAEVPLVCCSLNAGKVSWLPGLSAFGVWAPVPWCAGGNSSRCGSHVAQVHSDVIPEVSSLHACLWLLAEFCALFSMQNYRFLRYLCYEVQSDDLRLAEVPNRDISEFKWRSADVSSEFGALRMTKVSSFHFPALGLALDVEPLDEEISACPSRRALEPTCQSRRQTLVEAWRPIFARWDGGEEPRYSDFEERLGRFIPNELMDAKRNCVTQSNAGRTTRQLEQTHGRDENGNNPRMRCATRLQTT